VADKVKVDDVVVLLPGILGSVLSRNGDTWAISPSAVLRAITSLGGSLKDLQLTEGGHRASPDGIQATRVFKDTQIIPHFWKIDGYEKTARVLKETLALDDGDNYFEFPYDWRLDNRVAATQLAAKVEAWLQARRNKLGKQDVKLILLAHSMGGLVARYFIERLGGWSDTRMLITFGTPYHGSLQALGFLVNGYPVKIGPIKVFDFSRVMRSFPSVYQLLPMFDCLDIGAADLATLRTAGNRIPGLDRDMLKDAVDFHDEIASALEANVRSAAGSRRYEIHPIVGTEQPTYLRATINRRGKAEMHYDHPRYSRQGDTTVPWISAHPGDTRPIEAGKYFIECHGSLQNADDTLTDVRNLIARLTEGAMAIPRAAPPDGISLQLNDWFAPGPVEIAAKTSALGALHADIVDVEAGTAVGERVRLQLGRDGRHTATVPAMTRGVYRVTVASNANVRSVTDIFMVVG
jgi:pimeloyl-ACP methyl ester carboxylesterase